MELEKRLFSSSILPLISPPLISPLLPFFLTLPPFFLPCPFLPFFLSGRRDIALTATRLFLVYHQCRHQMVLLSRGCRPYIWSTPMCDYHADVCVWRRKQWLRSVDDDAVRPSVTPPTTTARPVAGSPSDVERPLSRHTSPATGPGYSGCRDAGVRRLRLCHLREIPAASARPLLARGLPQVFLLWLSSWRSRINALHQGQPPAMSTRLSPVRLIQHYHTLLRSRVSDVTRSQAVAG